MKKLAAPYVWAIIFVLTYSPVLPINTPNNITGDLPTLIMNRDNARAILYAQTNPHAINVPGEWGWTPLHYAVGFDYDGENINLINSLIRLGAVTTLTDMHGQTPAMIARDTGNEALAQYLEMTNLAMLIFRL